MAAAWIEKVTGSLEQKRQYRDYKRRVEALPEGYRDALAAVERYITYSGGVTQGDTLVAMFGDLIDLFEQSAADGVSVRAIVGDDPATIADTFLANYSTGGWVTKERDRLARSIDRVADQPADQQ